MAGKADVIIIDTRKKAAVLTALIAAAALLLLIFFLTAEKAVSKAVPDCLLREATGLRCVLCGGTRCVRELIKGHIAKAFYYNPFALLCGTAAAVMYLRLAFGTLARKYKPIRLGKGIMWVLLAGVLLFTLVRNMDFYKSIFY